MNAVTLALAKKYTDSKQIGGVTKNRVEVDYRDIDNDDITVMGMGLSRISDLTPTKQELLNGKISLNGHDSAKMIFDPVVYDDDMVYCGRLRFSGGDFDGMQSTFVVVVVYKTGEWADGGITIDQTGLFINNSGSGVSENEISVVFEWETIHPIDPKFLPGVCLPVKIDLADYGIDISSIVMAGGRVGFDTGEAFWKAIDTDARVFVKILSGFQSMDIWGELGTRLYDASGRLQQVSTHCPVYTGTNIVDATVFFSHNNGDADNRTTYVTVVSSIMNMPGQ